MNAEPSRPALYAYRARPWLLSGLLLTACSLGIILWGALGTGCPAVLYAITIAVAAPLALCLIAIGLCHCVKVPEGVPIAVFLTVVVVAVLVIFGLGPPFLEWFRMTHNSAP